MCHVFGAYRSPRPHLVLDQNRLTQGLRDTVGNVARQAVGRGSSRIWNDKANGFVSPFRSLQVGHRSHRNSGTG